MDATNIDHTHRAHSKIAGGSTADRVINCPASVKELLALPDIDSSSPAAERGTALHEAMEYYLANDVEITELGGMIFNRHEIDAELMNEALIPAAEAFAHYEAMCEHEGGLEFAIEQSVEITDMPVPEVFGTCDILGRTQRRTVVWDWKFGRGEVSPINNAQGLFYGAGALCTMPSMFGEGDEWPVDIVICQPADAEDGKPCYKRWTTTVGDLLDFMDTLEAAIKDAMESDNPKRSRGSHCQWAQCKVTCPLHVAPMQRIASLGEKLAILNSEPETSRDNVIDTVANKTVGEELALQYGHALDLCDAIEPWIRRIREDAHALLEAGHPVYGFKLVPKRASRTGWTDEKKAANLLRSLKLRKADTVTEKFITPAQAEKVLKASGLKMTEAQAKRFAELSPATSSGNTMAPSDDPRPEYKGLADKVTDLSTKLLGSRSLLPRAK